MLRQKDKEFVSVLQRFRLGQCTPNDEHYIRQTILHPAFCDGINATRLCTHNREAQVWIDLCIDPIELYITNMLACLSCKCGCGYLDCIYEPLLNLGMFYFKAISTEAMQSCVYLFFYLILYSIML